MKGTERESIFFFITMVHDPPFDDRQDLCAEIHGPPPPPTEDHEETDSVYDRRSAGPPDRDAGRSNS